MRVLQPPAQAMRDFSSGYTCPAGTRLESRNHMAAALALGIVPLILMAVLAISSTTASPLAIIGLLLFLTLLAGTGVGLLASARRLEG